MGKVRGWITARPILFVLVAFVVGGVIGGSPAAALRLEVADLENQLEDSRSSDEASEMELEDSLEELESENQALEEELTETQDVLTALKAKRPLPNFVGDFVGILDDMAEEFGWEVNVTERASASETPGTVLGQSPQPGTVMRSGASVKVVVAKEPPPGWKDIKVFSGQGETTTASFNLPKGRVRILYNFTGNTNAVITLYQQPRQYVELFLNEIGDRSGSTRVYYSGKRYYFEIMGGSWTVRLQEFY